jgi:hypothetical protein
MNQSQCRDNPITGRILITQETQEFSPEVHVLACTLGGSTANWYHTPRPPQEAPQEPTASEVTQ